MTLARTDSPFCCEIERKVRARGVKNNEIRLLVWLILSHFMESKAFVESLNYLYGLERFGMIFGLSNIERIVRALGNPHKDLKVVHVGGTNGKGSTAVMMASVLQESGYRVGLYTSPHILSFTERIQINGQEITEAEVAEMTARMRKQIEEAQILQRFTFFDFTTAMAFLYFAESGIDLAIMEVGLGGRLDSTNIVTPVVAVITNVSYEHRNVLGNSLSGIAREKAGIIKPGVPVMTGVTQQEILGQIQETCREKKAPLYLRGRDFVTEKERTGVFRFRGRRWDFSGIKINLLGDYQIDNAAMALGTLEAMEKAGFAVTRESVYGGLEKVEWPGRLEVIQKRPYVVLDGAHNPAGAEALSEALSQGFSYKRCFLLLGIMGDKEVERIVSILAPLSQETVLCQPKQDRAAPPERLLRATEAAGGKGRVIPDVAKGLDTLLSVAGSDDLICVAGSFYTIGEAKAHLLAGG
jgi:dihydrofolate synthase/folylpolyglutamate synthase